MPFVTVLRFLLLLILLYIYIIIIFFLKKANLLAENQKYFLWKSIFSTEFSEIFNLPKKKKIAKKKEEKRKSYFLFLAVLFLTQNRYRAYHSLHDSNLTWNCLAHLYKRIISKMSFDILPIAMSPLICMNLRRRLQRPKAGAIS